LGTTQSGRPELEFLDDGDVDWPANRRTRERLPSRDQGESTVRSLDRSILDYLAGFRRSERQL